MKQALDAFPSACHQLALKGWPLPVFLSINEVVTWAQDPPDELDQKFSDWFSANDGERFDTLASSCLERQILGPWLSLLEECISAYRRCEYRVTVPSLLAILEGILMAERGNSTRVVATAKQYRDAAPHEDHDSMLWLIWDAIHAYVSQLFKPAPFEAQRPSVLNRHWILHGRDESGAWNQSDSLRLFLGIETVSLMLDAEPV